MILPHSALKVTRRSGEDFIIVSADDWEREQETLHALQSKSLMKKIAESLKTYSQGNGYQPTQDEIDELTSL